MPYSLPTLLTYHLVTTEIFSSSHSIRSSNCYQSVSRNLNQLLLCLIVISKKNAFWEGPESSFFWCLPFSLPQTSNSTVLTIQGIIRCLQLWFVRLLVQLFTFTDFILIYSWGLLIQAFEKTHFIAKGMLGTLTQ